MNKAMHGSNRTDDFRRQGQFEETSCFFRFMFIWILYIVFLECINMHKLFSFIIFIGFRMISGTWCWNAGRRRRCSLALDLQALPFAVARAMTSLRRIVVEACRRQRPEVSSTYIDYKYIGWISIKYIVDTNKHQQTSHNVSLKYHSELWRDKTTVASARQNLLPDLTGMLWQQLYLHFCTARPPMQCLWHNWKNTWQND